MIVDLDSFPDLGLIVKAPTGVRYTTQVAGLGCEHPDVEGFFVPLRTKIGRPELATLSGSFRGDWNPISENQAEQLNAALKRHGLSSISSDATMLQESKEAWVHVLISNSEVEGVPLKISQTNAKGVLVWPNSD